MLSKRGTPLPHFDVSGFSGFYIDIPGSSDKGAALCHPHIEYTNKLNIYTSINKIAFTLINLHQSSCEEKQKYILELQTMWKKLVIDLDSYLHSFRLILEGVELNPTLRIKTQTERLSQTSKLQEQLIQIMSKLNELINVSKNNHLSGISGTIKYSVGILTWSTPQSETEKVALDCKKQLLLLQEELKSLTLEELQSIQSIGCPSIKL